MPIPYSDEQKKLAQARKYEELVRTINFSVPNSFSDPDPSQTSLFALCLDPTGNLLKDNIEKSLAALPPDILKQLLRNRARLHQIKKAGQDESEIEKLDSVFGRIQSTHKKYFLYYRIITKRVNLATISAADLHPIIDELKAVAQDTQAESTLKLSFEQSFNLMPEAKRHEEHNLELLLSLRDNVFSVKEKTDLFAGYLKRNCSKSLNDFVVNKINQAFLKRDEVWKEFLRKEGNIKYFEAFSLNGIHYQHYLAYLLSPGQAKLRKEQNAVKLLFFIFEKLHQQSPGFHNQAFKIAGQEEARHPLAWLMMCYSPPALECFLQFIKKKELNLQCGILGFNLYEKNFGHLEVLLGEHCAHDADQLIQFADLLRKYFLGAEDDSILYRSEQDSSQAASADLQGSPIPSAALTGLIERSDVSAFPLIQPGSSKKKSRAKRSSSGSSLRRGSASSGVGLSAEGMHHYRRRSSARSSLGSPVSARSPSDEELLEDIAENTSGSSARKRGFRNSPLSFPGMPSRLSSDESLLDAASAASSEQAEEEALPNRASAAPSAIKGRGSASQIASLKKSIPVELSPEQDSDGDSWDSDSEDEDGYSESYGVHGQFRKNPAFKVEPGKKYAVLARGLHFYRGQSQAASAADSAQGAAFFSKLQRKELRKRESFTDQQSAAVRADQPVQEVNAEYDKLRAPLPSGKVLRDRVTGKEYASAANLHQQVFSNTTGRYENMIRDPDFCRQYLSGADFVAAPFVSTTPKIREAMRYALGDRFSSSANKERRLRPRYDRMTGRPKYPYSGIVYLFAFTEEQLKHLPHNVVMQGYAQGKLHIDHRIVAEEEVSFIAQIPAECILAQARMRFPKFDQEYHPFIQKKYGLTKEQYQEFKQKIQESARGTEARRQVKREITEVLLRHWEKQAEDFVKRTLGARAYHRLDAVGVDERGLQDEPINLAVARLHRQFCLAQPEVGALCVAATDDLRLDLLKRYLKAWDEKKLSEPHLFRLLIKLGESGENILDRLRKYELLQGISVLIDFVKSKKPDIRQLQHSILDTQFNTQYPSLGWLNDLFLKKGQPFQEALSALDETKKSDLRNLRTFQGLFTGVTPAAILLEAYNKKEESGALAILWEEQDLNPGRPRGRAAGAAPGEFHLEVTAPAKPLKLQEFAPIELSSAATELPKVEALEMAIRFGQIDSVKAYLEFAEKLALEQARAELGEGVGAVYEKKLHDLAWKKYQVFLGEPADKSDALTPLHLACGYDGALADLKVFELLLGRRLGLHSLSVIVQVPETKDFPLHLAAVSGSLGIVKRILETVHQHNADKLNAAGNTALHEAARCGHLEVVKYLLCHATPSPKNSAEKTPGMLAREAGHELVATLLEPLDELTQLIADYCTQANSLLNRTVIESTHSEFLRVLRGLNQDLKPFARMACENHKFTLGNLRSGDERAREEIKCTLSYLVCRNKDLEILGELIRLGVNINFLPGRTKNHRLYPPFFEAIILGRMELVTEVLNLNWRYLYAKMDDSEGERPAYSADAFARAKDDAMRSLLLECHQQHRENLLSELSPENFEKLQTEIDGYTKAKKRPASLDPGEVVVLPEAKRRRIKPGVGPDTSSAASLMSDEPDDASSARRKRRRQQEHGFSSESDEEDRPKKQPDHRRASANPASFHADPSGASHSSPQPGVSYSPKH